MFWTEPIDGRIGLAGVHGGGAIRSEEHTSELQSRSDLVCRLLLEKKKKYERQRRPASEHARDSQLERSSRVRIGLEPPQVSLASAPSASRDRVSHAMSNGLASRSA